MTAPLAAGLGGGAGARGRSRRLVRPALVLGWLALATVATGSAPRTAEAAPADATALYNAGTAALDRGDLGRAVAFLRAADRIQPRAADIRRNLTEARDRAAVERGAEPPGAPAAFRLSAVESWWLTAALLVLSVLLFAHARFGRGRRTGPPPTLPSFPAAGAPARDAESVASAVLLLLGFLLVAWLALRAREEALHPEAVVVSATLAAGPAPDERPRAPYLLSEGEEVRLGPKRGALVEVRVAGTAIGWVERAGVWRVADAPRYTSGLPRP